MADDSMFTDLSAELDVPLIEWEPTTIGERIVGRVKTIEYVPVREGKEWMGLLLLETPNGSLARVAAGAKNLKSQLEAAKVQPGDGLAMQYEGERQPKNGGRAYNSYRVATHAVGPRDTALAFKVPEGSPEADLGLTNEAMADTSAWDSTSGPGF